METQQRRDAAMAVRLSGIGKRFPGVIANHDVNLNVRAGTIHAIVGENGAGKSTLMKTLYGMQQPDAGTIEIDGTERHFKSPSEAIEAGIGMVHQHFMLADNLTVLENIILGRAGPARSDQRQRSSSSHPGDRCRPRGRDRRRRAGERTRRRRAAAG